MRYRLLFLAIFLMIFSQVSFAYPQRIISGMPSVTEILFALDLGDRVVGVTTNCNYPPEARKKEKVGGFFINLEKVVFLKPDLIIMLEDAQKRDIKKFRDYGLNVYAINPRSVLEVMDSIVKIGEITGRKEKAQQLVSEMKRKIEPLQPKFVTLQFVLKRPRVLAVVGSNPLIVAAGGTFIDDVLKCAGAENIAEKAKSAYPQYSFEELLRVDPDCVIIPEGAITRDEIKRDKRWQSLQAVRNDKLLFINADILSRPGPRVVDAVEAIAKFIQVK